MSDYSTTPGVNLFNSSHLNQQKYVQTHLSGFVSQWYSAQRAAILNAERIIATRIHAEWKEEQKAEAEKARKEQEKIDEKERALEEKAERLRLEQEAEMERRKPKPFVVPPDHIRFSGTWCIAPQGKGKTNLLHGLIMNDVARDATVILMELKRGLD